MSIKKLLFILLLFIQTLVSAVDHAPVWSGTNSLTYNIRNLDNFAVLSYGYTRWGNIMDSETQIFQSQYTLNFSDLSIEHNSANTVQDSWDFFISQNTLSLIRQQFPTVTYDQEKVKFLRLEITE